MSEALNRLLKVLIIAINAQSHSVDAPFPPPPPWFGAGKLRTSTESDLISCLEELVNSPENATHHSVEVIILDGSVIANMLRPGSAKTFSDYASQGFLPYVASQRQSRTV